MDFIKKQFSAKKNVLEPIEFRLPIQTIDTFNEVNQNIIDDMELTKGENPMYQTIFGMESDFEKLNIESLAKYHSNDTTFLKDQQIFLKETNKITDDIDEKTINEITDLRKDISDETGFIEKYHFIEWDQLKFLNNNATFMKYLSLYELASPVLTLALPIFMLIIPFFIIRLQGHPINFSKYAEVLKVVLSRHSIGQIFNIGSASWDKRIYIIISFVFYLAQVYWNYQSCQKFLKNFKIIHDKLDICKNYLNKTVNNMNQVIDIVNSNSIDTFNIWVSEINTCKKYLETLISNYNYFTPYGLSMKKIGEIGYLMQNFYELYNDKYLISAIDYSIKFNAYLKNISGLRRRLDNEDIHECSFTNKKTVMKKAYYPTLVDDKYVANDIDLSKNIIVTGPNAAGKTTIIKTAMINILLSQQFGIGFYKKAKINTYKNLQCYINIPDTSGRDSLFQAEARRCKNIIDSLEKDNRQFCIFDELFSGTNPYEAIGAATGFLKYLNKYDNVTFIITTHFLDLCKKMDKEERIVNLNMEINQDNNNDFTYTYKIISGISNVKGGLKVLRDLGYPKDIIDMADDVLNNLNI